MNSNLPNLGPKNGSLSLAAHGLYPTIPPLAKADTHSPRVVNAQADSRSGSLKLALAISVSISVAVVACVVVALAWYCYQRHKLKKHPSLGNVSLLDNNDNKLLGGLSPKFHHLQERYKPGRSPSLHPSTHLQSRDQTPRTHQHHHHTPTQGHGHGHHKHKLHKEGSTSELTKKMHMLTRTISSRLLPSVDAIPPVHELVHPVLQQPVLEQAKEDTPAMQDDTCGTAMFGLGKLCFSVTYIEKVEMLHVNVHRAIHLPLHSARKFVNPYVKVKIVPPGTVKHFTKVHKHTPNPYFQESFVFRVLADDLQDQILKLIIYDHCKITSDVIVGHVNFNLRDITRSLTNHSRDAIWREIESDDTQKPTPYRGELMTTISYDHDLQRFTMGVVHGRKIQLADGSTPTAGVYVKVTILVAEQVWKSKRTKTAKTHPSDPIFHEEFSIKVTPTDVGHVNMLIAVYGKTSFSHCELIGRTSIGSYTYTTGQGLEHWIDMMTSPHTPAPMWHILT